MGRYRGGRKRGSFRDLPIYSGDPGGHNPIFEYVETFYNICRLHSSLSYKSLADFEEDRIEEARCVQQRRASSSS